MANNILVAGGTGLVGANLTFKLRELGFNVVSTRHHNRHPVFKNFLPCDLSRFEACLAITKGVSDVVFCASVVAGVQYHKQNPTSIILPSLTINAGLLEACAVNRVKKVIIISSTTVYQPANFSIKENQIDLNIPPYDDYYGVGWYNRYLEKLASFYSKTYGIKAIIFRPTSIYGPFDKFDGYRSHVIPSIIMRAFKKESPFEVWGNPDVVRDFIYVDDFVRDIIFSLSNDETPSDSPINICSGDPMTIKKTAEVIVDACDHSPEICFNPEKPSSIPYRTVDDKKYIRIFGNNRRTDFREGIKQTVNWYREFYNDRDQ